MEREQLALPNTETAEWGVSRGSKAVQKYNYSSDHKKMGSLGTCKECEAFLGILGSLFFFSPFLDRLSILNCLQLRSSECVILMWREIFSVYVNYIFYIMRIYIHTCYVTCMLGITKRVRRCEKKIRDVSILFSFYKLSLWLGQNIAKQMNRNNCSYLRD